MIISNLRCLLFTFLDCLLPPVVYMCYFSKHWITLKCNHLISHVLALHFKVQIVLDRDCSIYHQLTLTSKVASQFINVVSHLGVSESSWWIAGETHLVTLLILPPSLQVTSFNLNFLIAYWLASMKDWEPALLSQRFLSFCVLPVCCYISWC